MGFAEFNKLPTEEKKHIFNLIEYSVGLPTYATEKDWWVVRTLEIVFSLEVGAHLVFKGGTSLSKAWGLISRFSEDIDLALDKKFLGFDSDKPTRTQLERLRKKSHKYVSQDLCRQLLKGFEESGLEGVTIFPSPIQMLDSSQDPMVLEIYYPSISEPSEYLKPRILLEVGSRSQQEPFTRKEIQSIVGEENQNESFSDNPIHIPSVNPERTFLEKLFLLHEEFQKPKDKVRVERLSRHLYDIRMISMTEYSMNAILNHDLYRSIVTHRSIFTKIGSVDYGSHYPPNLNPIPPDDLLSAWEKDYKTMQSEMIYGESVPFKKLIEDLRILIKSINEKIVK